VLRLRGTGGPDAGIRVRPLWLADHRARRRCRGEDPTRARSSRRPSLG
jgi:hypothetical protein